MTGASRGIGRAITDALLPRLDLLVALAQDAGRLQELKVTLEQAKAGIQVSTIAVDLADSESTSKALDAWRFEYSDLEIDLLVLDAGTFTEGSLAKIPFDAFERDLRINLSSGVLIVQKVLPALLRSDSPRIFIIGSTAAYEKYPLVPSYAVAKWGLRAYANELREELRDRKVGVTFISPGGTNTAMWEGEELPPDRLLEPSDIGKLVASCLDLSEQAVVEELIVRSIEGDIHE
ncbi:hypothetical protein BJF78_15855 [Pseudonocardia sp. CNS-139]|nr:hypothetical protein BJF78_15855 [Pseudonocardia sp. CNS-139]